MYWFYKVIADVCRMKYRSWFLNCVWFLVNFDFLELVCEWNWYTLFGEQMFGLKCKLRPHYGNKNALIVQYYSIFCGCRYEQSVTNTGCQVKFLDIKQVQIYLSSKNTLHLKIVVSSKNTWRVRFVIIE